MRTKTPFLSALRQILADGIYKIDNEQCSEEYAAGLLGKFNAESRGYYNKGSLVNYDQAMEILGVRNRNKMLAICQTHGVKQKRINNQNIGFLRAEIEQIAYERRKEKA